jgi:Kef-type K+ transport system membrane component KefB
MYTAFFTCAKGVFFMSYHFLFEIALILLSTKVLGILTKRIALPQVVGALLAGLVMGPAMLGILKETALMDQLAELGVIVLMFNTGLETDLGELKKAGKSAFIIALLGVIVPLIGGFFLASAFNQGTDVLLQNFFIGVILTATSVSITVETLKEIGKLSTRSGNAILGAAIIDDVLGIVALTVITSLAGTGASVVVVLLKIAAFFALSVVVWMVLHRLADWWFRRYDRDKRRFVVISFAFCLLYAYLAEAVFGVADITGAYIAGLIFAKTPRVTYLQDRFETLSYALLSPIFFASIGLKVVLPQMSGTIILFSVLLVAWAVVSKVIGCGLGARLCHYNGQDCLRVGVGMISRGEVALIVANNGIAAGLMREDFFGPVVLMVVATTIVTPILLKLVYRGKEKDYSDLQESELVNRYEEAADFDLATQALLEDHERLRSGSAKKE